MAKTEKSMPHTKNATPILTLEKRREESADEVALSQFDIAAEKLANHPGWDEYLEAYHEMKQGPEHEPEEG